MSRVDPFGDKCGARITRCVLIDTYCAHVHAKVPEADQGLPIVIKRCGSRGRNFLSKTPCTSKFMGHRPWEFRIETQGHVGFRAAETKNTFMRVADRYEHRSPLCQCPKKLAMQWTDFLILVNVDVRDPGNYRRFGRQSNCRLQK